MITKTKKLSDAVMIQHTLFSLPFAVGVVVLETQGVISWQKAFWIILAVIGARNGANAHNRLADHDIDAANPRTKSRHLPSGTLSRRDLWIFTAVCAGVLILSAAMLGTLPLILLPGALGIIVLYSYSKRFTWMSHFILGAAVALAPMGALIAVTDTIALRFFPVPLGVTLWVAGFDIMYACQDVSFDRAWGLHSFPARFGERTALTVSTLCHVGTLASFGLLSYYYELGVYFWLGYAATAVLLAVEHVIVAPRRLNHVETASYHINEIVGVLFMLTLILEVYLG
jgi:4-hydroxybenzoate polyprenyltransferase